MRNAMNLNLMTTAIANLGRTGNAIGMGCAPVHPLHVADLRVSDDLRHLRPNSSDSAPEPATLCCESSESGGSTAQYQTRQQSQFGYRVCTLPGASWRLGRKPAKRLKSRFLAIGS